MTIYIPKEKLAQVTLCLLVRGDPPAELLLGYKKKGFGQGKYCSFGGKVEAGESIEAAARRELEEETGLRVAAQDLSYVAKLTFLFPLRPEWNQEVHAYLARSWQGQPIETDEMTPAWFTVDKIPYPKMWEDNAYWLPQLLTGRRIQGRFVFTADNETVREAEISDL